MQKYNRILSFIIVLILLTGLWIIIAFVSFSNTDKKSSNKNILPDEIDLVIELNTKELLETFLIDLLFKADISEESTKLFLPEEDSELAKLGADLTTEIVVFYDNWKNSSAKGVVLNISNEAEFTRYQFDDENTIKVSNSKYGVLIFLDDNAPKEAINYYSQLGERIINNEKKSESAINKKGLINLHYKGDKIEYFNDLKLDLNMKNQSISINGKGEINDKSDTRTIKFNIFEKPSKEKHLEIQTSKIPENAMNYLSSFIKKMGIEMPKITSQQMYIYGFSIDDFNRSTAFLPNFDWILRFDTLVEIDSVFSNLNSDYRSLVDLNNKTIKVGSMEYHYSQVSGHEIYIGVSKKPKFKIIEEKSSYIMRGSPAAILEIGGNSFFGGFIMMMPQVEISKQFFNDVTYFDIRANQDKGTMNIEGEIKLKDDQLVTVELARYMMMFLR